MRRPEEFTTVDVARSTGVSYRQLNYWRVTGLIRPTVREATGSGSYCVWSADDVVAVETIRKLLDLGVSLQAIRSAGGPRAMSAKLRASVLEEVAS